MKNKTLQRVLAFCLALCFCFTLGVVQPMEAKALAVESYVMYAIITGLAAMGITFTVAGGVDAMIQAMEEKVDEYQAQGEIIDFYDIVRGGIKLVPSPSGGTDPEGNDLYNLLFTATTWDALEKFVDWLTSDGGWANGLSEEKKYSLFLSTNDFQYYDNINIGTLGEEISTNQYSVIEQSTVTQANAYEDATGRQIIFYNPTGYSGSKFSVYKFYSGSSLYWGSSGGSILFGNIPYTKFQSDTGLTIENIVGYGLYYTPGSVTRLCYGFVLDNGYVYTPYKGASDGIFISEMEITYLTESFDIVTPGEIPRLTPEQTQGVMMQQLEIASPEIMEWANMVEETFIETGTIPQTEPEVIADPDYTPTPTPIPSPVVPEPDTPTYTDVETLGLPALGDALMAKFPFCLVTDIGRVINIFTTTRETPKWEVDILAPLADRIPFQGDTTLKLDFSEYEEVGTITRWVTTIGYVLFLLLITKQMITW